MENDESVVDVESVADIDPVEESAVGADSGGPASGTTSRRHGVSIVQPRRVGFNAPDNLCQDDARELQLGGSSRNLMIDDDELAS